MTPTVELRMPLQRNAPDKWGWDGPDEGIVAVRPVMREHFEANCPYVRELLEVTPDVIYYRIWRTVAGKELKQ